MLPRSRSCTPIYIHCSYIGSMQKHAFCLLSVSYTRWRYKKNIRISKISAPSLLLLHSFSKVYCNPGIGHEAMQNKLSKEDKSPTIKKREKRQKKRRRKKWREKERLSIDSSWSLPEKVSHLSQGRKNLFKEQSRIRISHQIFPHTCTSWSKGVTLPSEDSVLTRQYMRGKYATSLKYLQTPDKLL
jgi:hypothetical protein